MDLATGRGAVPLSFFESVCETPQEAARLHYRFNVARRESEAVQRMRSRR